MNNGCDLLIKNAKVYAPEELSGRKDILVRNGKIFKIGVKLKAPKNTSVLNCMGRIVAPGFIDVHAQGAGGYTVLDGTREALEASSLTLASTGTTSFLSTTVAVPGKAQSHLSLIGEAVKNSLPGARTLGSHIEGPFINIKKKGMIRPDTIRKPSKKFLNHLISEACGTIRMMTVAPELPGNLQLIKYMRKKNIIPSLGHTFATFDQAVSGIKAGITHATHFFNAMTPLNHRDPGAPGAVFESRTVTAQVIADGKHLVPPIIRVIYRIIGPKRICIITDSMPNLGLPDGKYRYFGSEYLSVNGTGYYKDGTLIGTAVPLNEMGRRFMEYTGASLSEIFTMLSLSSALTLGLKKGRIKKGFDADLVITDKKLNIFVSIVAGRKVYGHHEGF